MNKIKRALKLVVPEARSATFNLIPQDDHGKSIRAIVSGSLKFIRYELVIAANGIETLSGILSNSFVLIPVDRELLHRDESSLPEHSREKPPVIPGD
jgi:hypothetical protein